MSREPPEQAGHGAASGSPGRASPRPGPGRKLVTVLVIIVVITALLLALTFVALAAQSSVRGYVAGEGRWSNAQRDAVLMLQMYGQTRRPEYLERFEAAIAVPLGDHAARIELERPDFDRAVAEQGLLQGDNHPDDIPGMIRLFRCCAKLPHLQSVIRYWERGDEHVFLLIDLAHQLRREIESDAPSPQRIAGLLDQVHVVNESVRPLEAAFTATLGDAARWVSSLLFLVASTIIVLLIAAGAWVCWRILLSIRATEERYRVLLDSAGDALIVVDEETGQVVEANPRAEKMTGRTRAALIGSVYADVFEDEPGQSQASGQRRHERFRRLRVAAGAPEAPVEVNNSLTEWNGRPACLAIVRDIGERVRILQELRIVGKAVANMAEGVVVTDADFRIVSVNRAYTLITGFEAAEVLGATPRYETASPGERRKLRYVSRTLLRTGRWQGELWSRRKNGEMYPQSLSVCSVADDDGKVTHYVGLFQDNSAFREHERRLEHLARHDPLTRLPNRRMFEERGAETLARAIETRSRAALLFIDLDGFKAVNDTYGHVAGDQVLRVVGERLGRCTREDDMIARMGGDEFTVLFDGAAPEDAMRLAQRILLRLAEPLTFEEKNLEISASIGIGLAPEDAADIATLLTRADSAMYEAKMSGKNTFRFFGVDGTKAA